MMLTPRCRSGPPTASKFAPDEFVATLLPPYGFYGLYEANQCRIAKANTITIQSAAITVKQIFA